MKHTALMMASLAVAFGVVLGYRGRAEREFQATGERCHAHGT
jgi:hypothetical protein